MSKEFSKESFTELLNETVLLLKSVLYFFKGEVERGRGGILPTMVLLGTSLRYPTTIYIDGPTTTNDLDCC